MTLPFVSFQGRPGAYSDLACRGALPGRPTLPCDTFEGAIEAVRSGAAELAMLPCENSLAGRVPDIHSLLPGSGLHIVGEHFQPVQHCLLGPPGATVAGVRRVHSHAVALGQIRRLVQELGVTAIVAADTAEFGLPETKVGIIGECGVVHRAVRQLPHRVAMAMILCFLFTLYPAFKAASTDPVQVLRYE